MSFPHHPFSGFRLTPKNVNSGKIVLPLSQTTSVMAAAKWLGLTFKQEERWERDVNLQHISVPLNAVSSNTLLVFLITFGGITCSVKNTEVSIQIITTALLEKILHPSLNTKFFAFLLNVTLLGKNGIQGPETHYFCVIRLYIWIQLS